MWCVFQEHKQFLFSVYWGLALIAAQWDPTLCLKGTLWLAVTAGGKRQGGRHLQEDHWHTLDVWNSLGSVLGTKIKVSPHRLCLSLGEGQPLLCLNSPGCHRAQESILDYKIKRGDLNQCSLNMHTIAVFVWRFIQKEATNLDFWLLTLDSLAFARHLALFENIYAALHGALSGHGGGLLDVVPLGKCPIVHMVYPALSSGQCFCNMLTKQSHTYILEYVSGHFFRTL